MASRILLAAAFPFILAGGLFLLLLFGLGALLAWVVDRVG